MSNISSFPTAIPDGDDLILGSQIDVAGIPSTKNFTVQSIVDLVPGGGGGGSYLPLAGGTMTGNTIHNDNVKSVYGTGNDLQIYNSGNNSYIQNISGAVGDLFIDNLVDDKDIILRSDNGAGSITNYIVCDGSNGSVSLNHYGNLKLETTTSGVDAYGTLNIYDPVSLTDRVRIYNDGVTSYIDSPNNPLQIGVDSFKIKGTDGLTNMIAANSAGGVSLYHVGGQKLYTKTNGIAVTGTIQQLTDPSAAQDAATKNYVDNAVSGVDLTSYLLNTTDTFTGTLALTGKLVLGDTLNNSFIGLSSGFSNTTGGLNVGLGYFSLFGNTTGASNIAIGNSSGRFIADGATENETGGNSIFIGKSTRANADGQTNQIVIGTDAIGAGSNTVTLGNDNITNTYLKGDVTVAGNLIGGLPYTSLVQLLTQTSTNAPVATEVYNNTGQTYTWTRTGAGTFRITATNTPFTFDKTVVFVNAGKSENTFLPIYWEYVNTNTIDLLTYDNELENASFEIKIYN